MIPKDQVVNKILNFENLINLIDLQLFNHYLPNKFFSEMQFKQ